MRDFIETLGETLLDWIFALMPFFFVLLVVGGVAFSAFLFWKVSTRTSFELPINEWECVATKPQVSVIYVKSGEVLIPVQTTSEVCIEYRRKY